MTKNISNKFYSIRVEQISSQKVNLFHKWKAGLLGKILFKPRFNKYLQEIKTTKEELNERNCSIDEIFYHC